MCKGINSGIGLPLSSWAISSKFLKKGKGINWENICIGKYCVKIPPAIKPTINSIKTDST